ncbi:MAG: hypothetical protein C4523_09570 [Myxococcales bacterium]|nr:MAG: hypothetical protein C4523_09570 [Myxococcales bacterium]
MRGFAALAAVAAAMFLAGCDAPSGADADRSAFAGSLLSEPPERYDLPVGIVLDDKVEVLGIDYSPRPLAHGKPYTMTFYFKVLDRMPADHQFFVHVEPASGPRARHVIDRPVLDGKYPTAAWRKGEIIKDEHRGVFPAAFPAAKAVLWGGFFKGDTRLPVAAKDRSKADADGRARLGVAPLDEPSDARREIVVPKAQGKIAVDGEFDEADWERAGKTGPFVAVSGEKAEGAATAARLLWDEQFLYIAFECEDEDVWTSFSKRDDPLYREETTEVMIDADGSASTYYEIQVNAAGAVYDAYFPERRKNMDLAFDAKLVSAAAVEGTLNQREDQDKRWAVEMAVPFASIADAPHRPPLPGDRWRLNLYRLDRPAKRGAQASMWSPTLVGDFHMLDRFGTIVFGETSAAATKADAPPAETAPADPDGKKPQLIKMRIPEAKKK